MNQLSDTRKSKKKQPEEEDSVKLMKSKLESERSLIKESIRLKDQDLKRAK